MQLTRRVLAFQSLAKVILLCFVLFASQLGGLGQAEETTFVWNWDSGTIEDWVAGFGTTLSIEPGRSDTFALGLEGAGASAGALIDNVPIDPRTIVGGQFGNYPGMTSAIYVDVDRRVDANLGGYLRLWIYGEQSWAELITRPDEGKGYIEDLGDGWFRHYFRCTAHYEYSADDDYSDWAGRIQLSWYKGLNPTGNNIRFDNFTVKIMSEAETNIIIEIQALITGQDHLIIKGNTFQWHHLEQSAPGRNLGGNAPTIINIPWVGRDEWFPQWPSPPSIQIDYEAYSSVWENIPYSLPTDGVPWTLEKQFGYGEVKIVEQPTEGNDYSLVLEFDDRSFADANFYAVKLSQVQEVLIDIHPWKRVNKINPCSKGAVYVTIFTTKTEDGDPLSFDATKVDPDSVRGGPAKATPIGHLLRDIDWDGDKDLLVLFWIKEMGISFGETEATLTGSTYDGHPFQGTDSIKTVGCR